MGVGITLGSELAQVHRYIPAAAPRAADSRSFMGAVRIALFDRGHRLSGHPGKGLNFSFQGERLGGKFSVLDGVPIASRSPAGGPVHPADARPPHGWRAAL